MALLPVNPEGLQSAIKSIKSIIKDANGADLLDANGNKLALAELENGDEVMLAVQEEASNAVKVINRTLDVVSDFKIVDRVKTLRQKLTSDYKRSGNFGWAETEISSLTKTEYYAHSGIDELTGTLPDRVPDISLKPQVEIFPWSTIPNSAGYPIARNIDTEYKILTEIAQKLGSNTDVTGKIRLFTERAPCESCSNVINLFSKKYNKLEIEVIHNNGVLLTDF